MNAANKILALAVMLMLTGCAGWGSYNEVIKLDRAAPVGSPYTRYLAGEYRDLANRLQGYVPDADAKHFARKGLAAADGMLVMPEVVSDWDMSAESIAEMTQARSELVGLLENGGRESSPGKAAYAQSRFDCWAGEQEKSWSLSWNRGGSCKKQFRAAMNDLSADIAKSAVLPPLTSAEEDFPAPVTDAVRGPTGPLHEAEFLVFFDWDKYSLSGGAHDVLDTVSQEIKLRGDVKRVVIVGHTDTSGSEKYNKNLSIKRANAVRAALARDLPDQKIRVEGRGETDLLVKTTDNVREQQNRRAEITLE